MALSFSKQQLQELTDRALEYLRKLSGREKALIAGAVLLPLLWLGYTLYEASTSAFTEQSLEAHRLEDLRKNLPEVLSTYASLHARRKAVDNRFKASQMQESISTYVERLVRSKFGSTANFTVNDQSPMPLGDQYELVPYAIRFNTANLQALVDFLRELSEGNEKLLLKELNLRKSVNNDQIEVNLKVGVLRNRGANDATAT